MKMAPLKTQGRVEVAMGVSTTIPVLANYHSITRLVIEDAHRRLIHAGIKDTCQLLREYSASPPNDCKRGEELRSVPERGLRQSSDHPGHSQS